MVFCLVTGWVIAGYFGALMLGGIFGPLPPRRQMAMRFGTLTVLAVVAGVSRTVAAFAIGDLPGSVAGACLLGILTVLTTSAVATGLQALLGSLAVVILVLLLIVIGYPGSGGPLAPELLPGFWRTTGQLLPVGASVTALRDIVYFPAAALAGPLLTLVAWLLGGAAVALGLAGRKVRPQPVQQHETDMAGAAAAAP